MPKCVALEFVIGICSTVSRQRSSSRRSASLSNSHGSGSGVGFGASIGCRDVLVLGPFPEHKEHKEYADYADCAVDLRTIAILYDIYCLML